MSPRPFYIIKLELPDTHSKDWALISIFCLFSTILVFAGFMFLSSSLIGIITGDGGAESSLGLFYGVASLSIGVGFFMAAFVFLHSQLKK